MAEYERPYARSIAERLAALEAQFMNLVANQGRLEAHLENQDRMLDAISSSLREIQYDRRILGKVGTWVYGVIAAIAGYAAHWLLPLPR